MKSLEHCVISQPLFGPASNDLTIFFFSLIFLSCICTNNYLKSPCMFQSLNCGWVDEICLINFGFISKLLLTRPQLINWPLWGFGCVSLNFSADSKASCQILLSFLSLITYSTSYYFSIFITSYQIFFFLFYLFIYCFIFFLFALFLIMYTEMNMFFVLFFI